MAHFAKLNEHNVVTHIDTIDNEVMLDENGIEQEALGIAYLKSLFGDQKWVQTSVNTSGNIHREGRTPLRKNYAVIDGYYDESKDAFIDVQPYPSWVLDPDTFIWNAPIARPDLRNQIWDEETLSWVTKE
jgi:hypothetical protein